MVEGSGLENRRSRKGAVGSNPTTSTLFPPTPLRELSTLLSTEQNSALHPSWSQRSDTDPEETLRSQANFPLTRRALDDKGTSLET